MKPSASVVVPVYNSEQTLAPLVERLVPALSAAFSAHEIILVNDGSRDGSWAEAERLAAAVPSVVAIDLMRNYGQHNALLCGIVEARHELVLTIDDDLQHPPEEIPRLLATMRKSGADVVYGAPRRVRQSGFRALASTVTRITLQRAMGEESARHVSAFRLFRTSLREAFRGHRGGIPNLDAMLTWGTSRFAVCHVRHERRRVGASNYTIWKLADHALNMLTGYSTLPLRLASLLGFAFTLLGGALLLFVVGRYVLFGTTVAGFPFLASSIALFSGVQLFALGIIGEYLARLHTRGLGKPHYVVRGRAGAPRRG